MMSFGVLVVPTLLILFAAWVVYLVLRPSTAQRAYIRTSDADDSSVFSDSIGQCNLDGTPMSGGFDLHGTPYGMSDSSEN